MPTPESILKTTFGYDTFKPLQREIIANVQARRDTLVIMATGGGKSNGDGGGGKNGGVIRTTDKATRGRQAVSLRQPAIQQAAVASIHRQLETVAKATAAQGETTLLCSTPANRRRWHWRHLAPRGRHDP